MFRATSVQLLAPYVVFLQTYAKKHPALVGVPFNKRAQACKKLYKSMPAPVRRTLMKRAAAAPGLPRKIQLDLSAPKKPKASPFSKFFKKNYKTVKGPMPKRMIALAKVYRKKNPSAPCNKFKSRKEYKKTWKRLQLKAAGF